MERETITRWNTPEIKQAYKELEKVRLNPKFRMEYFLRVKYLNDRVWELRESYDEGYTKGFEEGYRKGLEELGKKLGEKSAKARFALLLLNDGMDKKKIASLVGISMEELKKILPKAPEGLLP